ncbi:IS66 family insertion sequence element accessory protein TnpB [Pseudomonas monteilii]|nr:IS66 family insertion sequence element accessory protein TnpB [Pseudomonas monteilii]
MLITLCSPAQKLSRYSGTPGSVFSQHNGRNWVSFRSAATHCAYLFANRRANRMKVLVHDGFGIWLAARRLSQGKFHWPSIRHGSEMQLDTEQLQALVLGLPWQRAGSGGSITLL